MDGLALSKGGFRVAFVVSEVVLQKVTYFC